MSSLLLLVVVLAALGVYSVLLLAVFAGRAFRTAGREGRREVVDRAARRANLRAVPTPVYDAVARSMAAHPAGKGRA